MSKLHIFKQNGQKGVVHFLLPLILLLGIGVGVYLVQKSGFQIFKPKAGGGPVRFIYSSESANSCVTNKDGKMVTTCPKVEFEILVPVDQK